MDVLEDICKNMKVPASTTQIEREAHELTSLFTGLFQVDQFGAQPPSMLLFCAVAVSSMAMAFTVALSPPQRHPVPISGTQSPSVAPCHHQWHSVPLNATQSPSTPLSPASTPLSPASTPLSPASPLRCWLLHNGCNPSGCCSCPFGGCSCLFGAR